MFELLLEKQGARLEVGRELCRAPNGLSLQCKEVLVDADSLKRSNEGGVVAPLSAQWEDKHPRQRHSKSPGTHRGGSPPAVRWDGKKEGRLGRRGGAGVEKLLDVVSEARCHAFAG